MPIPLIAGAGAWLAKSALMQSPIGSFVKAVPKQVWIGLAIAAAVAFIIWRAIAWYDGKIDAAEKRGEDRAYARVEAKALRIAKDAAELSRKAKELNNATNRRIAADADALRVSGPGKAACRNPATPGASRYVAPAGKPDAAGPQVPAGNGEALLAAVPWPWLVDRAEQCDLNRAEAETWRNWHRQLEEAYRKIEHP